MYIPLHTAPPREAPPTPPAVYLVNLLHARTPSTATGHNVLRGRQFTGDAGRDANIKIGIIVAVVLTVFIAAVGAFMYTYRGSIRFTYSGRKGKGRRRRKSTGSSKSSKSSKSAAGSDGGGAPPAPPPEPTPPPA